MGILDTLISLYELWGSWESKRLTKAEKELLKKAEKNKGEIFVFKSDQTGEFIGVGKEKLIDDHDPSIRAKYMEALERLWRRGLVRHESGQLFCLTGSGFDEAKKLINKKR